MNANERELQSGHDIDHAKLVGGAASPLFLKSNVNLSGTSSKSQAGRLITARLREELGGASPAEWKAARQVAFRTTVLVLNTEPGMVCSMTHPDMPGGYGEFRVTSWRLNKHFSIDIQGRTTTDSLYDLVARSKPADVPASPVPVDPLGDSGVPAEPSFGISSRGLGDLIISAIGFPTLNNTTSIFAGTWKILYYDKTAAPTGRLASDVDPATTVVVVDNTSAFTVGKVYAIDREAVKVTARDTTANTTTVERAQFGSLAERHPGPKAINHLTTAMTLLRFQGSAATMGRTGTGMRWWLTPLT